MIGFRGIAVVFLAAATVGAGGGAAAYALLSDSGATTIVRQVTVPRAQPVSRATRLSVNEIYRRSHRGVVQITVTENATSQTPFGAQPAQQAQGSGFVYDRRGDIVTNQHVVDGASSISVTFWNGRTYQARLVGSDASTDLAVIHVSVPAALLSTLPLGDSGQLSVGDSVVAIGSPFGLSETVTSGIVSALHRQITSPNGFAIGDSIQTDAAINHGNSGGPLLDALGRVVGVTAQIKSDSGGNEGVGFAIPSNTVRSVVSQILATGKVEHAYLGVALDSSAQAARLSAVRPGTPAARAGLRTGDVITTLDGRQVASAEELQNAISGRKPGETVSLRYTRGGSSHTVRVTLTSRPG